MTPVSSDKFLSHGKRSLPWENYLILSHLIGAKNAKTIPICNTRKQEFRTEIRKKIKCCNSSNNSNNNIKETISYFKDKNHKGKKKYKNYETLSSLLDSVDTIFLLEQLQHL